MNRTSRSADRANHRSFEVAHPVDFSRLDCERARERVRQLRTIGLGDYVIADMVAWPADLVRRALEMHSQ